MPHGIYLGDDGRVVVEYGKARVSITLAQYRANGYRPPYDRLPRTAQGLILRDDVFRRQRRVSPPKRR